MSLFNRLTEARKRSRLWLIIVRALPFFLLAFLLQDCRLRAFAREVKQPSTASVCNKVELDPTCLMEKEEPRQGLKSSERMNPLRPLPRLAIQSRNKPFLPKIARTRRSKPPLLQTNLLGYLALVAGIGVPLCLLASKVASQSPQIEASTDHSAQPSTSYVREADIPSASDDRLSPKIGIETSANDGPEKGKDPIWIRYQPRFGPWVTIAVGDQLVATHRFKRFGIKEWQIGEIVEIEDSGHIIVGFHPDAPSYYSNEPELYTHINDNEPEPYWSSPFVLLESSLKRVLPPLGLRNQDRTPKLDRAGKHLFDLLLKA